MLGLPQPAVGAAEEHGERSEGVALVDQRLHERTRFAAALADKHRVTRPDMGGEIDRHGPQDRNASVQLDRRSPQITRDVTGDVTSVMLGS